MSIRARLALASDLPAVRKLVNDHELNVDPAASLMSESSTSDFMAGYVEPSPTHLLSWGEEEDFSAVVNLHPDSVRRRYFADVYASPHLEQLEEVVGWALRQAASEHPDWQIWPGMNSKDYRLRQVWGRFGFLFLRQYFTMRMSIGELVEHHNPEGLQIRALDVASDKEMQLWHSLHQRSFSGHFGFASRPFENWIELVQSESSRDPNGVWLAEFQGVPVGFCECSDEYAEVRRGFISSIGVIEEFRGLGVGEALLRHGISYCARKGYKDVELNVDTGNESGALRLYEKVGFIAESSWIQMANDNWRDQVAS